MSLGNSLVLCLAPDDRLVKEKGVASPKYTKIIKGRSNKWNLEWSAPLSLSHTHTHGNLVIVKLTLPQWSQNVSVVQIRDFSKCIWKNYSWLIRSPLSKSKNEHLKKRKKPAYFHQPPTEKQLIQVSNIHIFLPSRMPGLVVKLFTIIDWKCSWLSKIIWG